jgi:hypothetical protein
VSTTILNQILNDQEIGMQLDEVTQETSGDEDSVELFDGNKV